MTEAELTELKWATAQLRHSYKILIALTEFGLKDPKGLAEGLISPQIKTLEKLIEKYDH